MRFRIDVEMPPGTYELSGSVADFLAELAREYDGSGNEFGNFAGTRWTITFQGE